MSAEEKIISFYKGATAEEKVEVLFKRHYPALCQGVNNILKDQELSEDVVQEVFIKIWEKRNTLELHENFIFYLKRSCYNAALNALSALKNKAAGVVMEINVTAQSKADEEILFSELDKQVQLAITNLPERTRLVFTLSRYEEMSYKEIASELQVSVKAVEKHMGIALKKLRVSLQDYIYVLLLCFLEGF